MIFQQTKEHGNILERVVSLLSKESPVFLVGGAVRDYLLNKNSHDFDFIFPGEVTPIARSVANALSGSFYVMDDERQTARVIIGNSTRFIFDFASMRGETIEADLGKRDFTVNAIAINLEFPEELIDPLLGVRDLKDKVLRACSSNSFSEDPLRTLRGIRLAFSLGFKLDSNTIIDLKKSITELEQVSIERKRDEVFRIFEGQKVSSAIGVMGVLGADKQVFPLLASVGGSPSISNPEMDIWNKTISTVRHLGSLLGILIEQPRHGEADNLVYGLALTRLNKYREKIKRRYEQCLSGDRSQKSLLILASMYSFLCENDDSRAYSGVFPVDRPVNREKALSGYFKGTFALSQLESRRISQIILGKKMLDTLSDAIICKERRAIHRYFKSSKEAGLDAAILSLAIFLAENGNALSPDGWNLRVQLVANLFEAWWENQDDIVSPKRLLTGYQLQVLLNLEPGPIYGRILELLEEEQAAGEITSIEEAERFVVKTIRKILLD